MLAALYFNENSSRLQVERKADGEKRYKIAFPKFKKDEYTVWQVKLKPHLQWAPRMQSVITYACKKKKKSTSCYYFAALSSAEYVDSLLDEVSHICLDEYLCQSKALQIPPSLCSNYERPYKEDPIKKHRTCFNKER